MTVTLTDDWDREVSVQTGVTLTVSKRGRVRGALLGIAPDGTVFRFCNRIRLGGEPFYELWKSDDGYVWRRRLDDPGRE